jgi:hypothetical protein
VIAESSGTSVYDANDAAEHAARHVLRLKRKTEPDEDTVDPDKPAWFITEVTGYTWPAYAYPPPPGSKPTEAAMRAKAQLQASIIFGIRSYANS